MTIFERQEKTARDLLKCALIDHLITQKDYDEFVQKLDKIK